MEQLRTLTIFFKNRIKGEDIPKLRGAVIASIENADTLFHNHTEMGLRYSYPLIQYKRIHGKAAIVCVGKGVDVIGMMFKREGMYYAIGKEREVYEVENIRPAKTVIQVWNTMREYRLRRWLPFNSDSYARYKTATDDESRNKILQTILTGNILSFAKGVDIYVEKQITSRIESIERVTVTDYKGVKMTAFDIRFSTNLYLPDYIGLGKGVSRGFGTVSHISIEKREDDNKQQNIN